MTTSSGQFVDWMANQLSQVIDYYVPEWPYPDTPADGYMDIVRKIFGHTLSKESVVAAYKSGWAVPALQDELNEWFETSVITPEIANQLARDMIVNSLGPDALND